MKKLITAGVLICLAINFNPLFSQSDARVNEIHQLKMKKAKISRQIITLDLQRDELHDKRNRLLNEQDRILFKISKLENELYHGNSNDVPSSTPRELSERIQQERKAEAERKRIEEERRKEQERLDKQDADIRRQTFTAFAKSTGDTDAEGEDTGCGFNLQDRKLIGGLPKPTYNINEEGIIQVKIRVDRNGNVTSAEFQLKGSTSRNNYLREKSIEAAKKAKFNSDKQASAYQEGTITYHFVLD